jgi:ATP-dependent Zn protease
MNTEQNIKTQILSFFERLTTKTLSSNKFSAKVDLLLPTCLARIERSSHEHKIFIRSKLVFQPGNLATFISILPFIIGFSQFLTQKYSSQKNNLFFEQNLPGVSFPTQKIHWDTFQYLFQTQNNKDILTRFKTNKITWSDKDLIITTPITDLLTPASEKKLIGYINQSGDSDKITITSKWYKILFFEKNLTFTSLFYQNLDEIPIKLEGSYQSYKNTKPINFSSNRLFTSSEKIISFSNSKIKPRFSSDQFYKTTFLIGYKPKDSFQIVRDSQLKTTIVEKSFVNQISYQKQKELFINEYLLNSEIRKVFLNTNFAPSISFLRNSSNPTKMLEENLIKRDFLKLEEGQIFPEIIRQIDKIELPGPLTSTRLMSGYRYPDMNLTEVICFLLQKNNSKLWNLKILLPSSYLFPQFTNFNHFKVPTYLIQSKQLTLKDNLQREIFYQGPTVLLDKETGFDWKINTQNSTPFRLWLENYLGATNPSSQSIKNFFGIFDSPENLTQTPISKSLSEKEKYLFKHLSIFQNGSITNPLTSYLPFTRSFQLPAISLKDWENHLLKDLGINDLNSVQYNTVLLPIFEVRNPKLKNPEIFFGYKNSLDFEFIHPLRSIFQSRRLKSFPSNLNQMDFRVNGSTFGYGHSFPSKLTSGKYQKIPSIFQKNSTVFFSDIWEPLTFNSWLITAQIGFAFLVFKILKALADNYGRELLVYLLDLVALLGFLDDDLKQEIEILMGQREKGFRIISKITKNFNNIGGIQTLLPEIIEIVWFLRNSGREFSISKTLPRGVLLTGPPGTGKTLLVQAIAGEAEVPVLALSGSSLLEPGESGALKLEILFQEARKTAPCIVFIDEMDTLAEKREQVLQNPMGADEVIESLSNIKSVQSPSESLRKSSTPENSDEIADAIFAQQDMHKEKLRILMQFLVELDGIQGRDGVVVIGATNRPEMLDPAILRPGRFDRILELGLPGPEKRREILTLYSENLGINQDISWNYLIHRTAGYSAADLAGIMNQSTLHAILKNSHHTIETIEYGIDRITTIGLEKPQKTRNQKSLASQVAYYQAGKILVSALLEHHPPTLVTHLWPRRTNVRALQINENLQKYFFRFARRIELEHRIIGCYAGKAAEILFLQEVSHSTNLSDLGTEDIQFAQNLIKYMIQNWYFYGKNIAIQQNSNILTLFNEKEYRDLTDKVPFFNSMLETNELSLINKGEQFGNNSYTPNFLGESSIEQDPQKYFPTASWQYQISNEFELATRAFSDWYRLYLPDPQQSERNLEWTPPDEFYHGNLFADKLTESITWNQISEIQIDYEMHSLILQSFNKAITLLDQHREILDRLAYELLASEILREPEVQKILKEFNFNLDDSTSKDQFDWDRNYKNFLQQETTISKNWGESSRRSKSRWINGKLITDAK